MKPFFVDKIKYSVVVCISKRAWRNWQTRQTQDLVGDRGGSSPFARTKKGPTERLGLFLCEKAKGLELRRKFACKFARRAKMSSGHFIGRLERSESYYPCQKKNTFLCSFFISNSQEFDYNVTLVTIIRAIAS